MGWSYTLDELAAAIRSTTSSPHLPFSSISTDTRTITPGSVFFALPGETFDAHSFVPDAFAKGAVAAIVSKPIEAPGPCLQVENTLEALQEFAGWHRQNYDLPIIAITGSAGKTTTKDFAAALLASRYRVVWTQGNLNNEIGCPLSLLQIDEAADIAVIEMGANHVGEIARLCSIAKPTESVITLIAPAHIEGFGSIENVAAAKGEIMQGLPDGGVFYVNTADPRCVAIGDRFHGRVIRCGPGGEVCLRTSQRLANGDLMLDVEPIGVITIPLASKAHISNVLIAIAIGLQHGISDFETPLRQAAANARRFKVLTVGPLTILDDSYNANPASMKAALDTLGEYTTGRRFAALGDMLEMGSDSPKYHAEIGEHAAKCGVDLLIARGRYGRDTISGAQSAGIPQSFAMDDYDAIARRLLDDAREGDVLLVKGSRGMAMEKVIQSLQNILGKQAS